MYFYSDRQKLPSILRQDFPPALLPKTLLTGDRDGPRWSTTPKPQQHTKKTVPMQQPRPTSLCGSSPLPFNASCWSVLHFLFCLKGPHKKGVRWMKQSTTFQMFFFCFFTPYFVSGCFSSIQKPTQAFQIAWRNDFFCFEQQNYPLVISQTAFASLLRFQRSLPCSILEEGWPMRDTQTSLELK